MKRHQHCWKVNSFLLLFGLIQKGCLEFWLQQKNRFAHLHFPARLKDFFPFLEKAKLLYQFFNNKKPYELCGYHRAS